MMKLFLTFLLTSCIHIINAQPSSLEKRMANLSGTFSLPDRFMECPVSSDFYFFSNDSSLPYTSRKFLRNMSYGIIMKDSSIFIGFHYAPLDPRNDTARLFQAMFPGRKANDTYLLAIKHKANLLSDVKFHEPSISQRLGVDISGEYSLKLFHKYLGVYPRSHVVFMQKNNAFNFEVFVFYKDFRETEAHQYVRHIDEIVNFRRSLNSE